MDLLVYTPKITPRISYVLNVLFNYISTTPYQLTENLEAYLGFEGPSLNYSEAARAKKEIWIPASTFLVEKEIRNCRFSCKTYDAIPYGVERDFPAADYPFDLLAFCFYLLSRYEEYLPFQKDQHQRFPIIESWSYKHQLHLNCLVDEWANHLRKGLKERFPGLNIKAPQYEFIPSYDIDIAWAFKNRPLYRLGGSLVKDAIQGNWPKLKARARTQLLGQEDPFFTFYFLDQLHSKHELSALYFFLLGDLGKYDRNISPKNKDNVDLIQTLSKKYESGIHPSYFSNASDKQLAIEMGRYELITGGWPQKSRQHYLYLQFPTTYRRLLSLGIKEDYSLGYAQVPGFRASIAHPFPWYDLEKEEETDLILHPFAFMDVALRRAADKALPKAREIALRIIEYVKQQNGLLYILWHNSSFAEHEGWQGWQEFYIELIKAAKTKT